nr:UDP-N-acetylglucosamine 2-epimerase [Saccharopolyspora shandongensis]
MHTGQHYTTGMTSNLTPHLTLSTQLSNERGNQLGYWISALDTILRDYAPDVVLVQGDTTRAAMTSSSLRTR